MFIICLGGKKKADIPILVKSKSLLKISNKIFHYPQWESFIPTVLHLGRTVHDEEIYRRFGFQLP